MRKPRLLLVAKTFIIDPAFLFSWCFSQSEKNPSLDSVSPPPVSVTDNGLPHKHYSEVVRQLCPSPSPNCASFEATEVKAISDIPIEAGGYADILEATLYDRNVIQKSYRFYETGDVESIFRRYCREISACSQLSHPNIVSFVGITSMPNYPLSLIFDTAGHLGLREYLERNPQADKLGLVRGIARGLKHVHNLDIIHGRICSNTLVSPDGTPRITGFGSSLVISRPDLWPDKDIAGFHRGSAPELMRSPKPGKPDAQITKESDMYAFGMLALEIFSGKTPFPGDPDATVVVRVLRGDRPSRPSDCFGLSGRVWRVVKACWHDSPSRRVAVGDVVTLLDSE